MVVGVPKWLLGRIVVPGVSTLDGNGKGRGGDEINNGMRNNRRI